MACACVVLAGGAATRMGGGDKPLLTAGRATLLARLLERLAGEGRPLAINARGDAGRFAAYGLPVLPDEIEGAGPLAGVLAAMDWAAGLGRAEVLTVPGDTPFVPRGLAAMLAPAAAVAVSGGRRHHLVALWPVAARAALRERLRAIGPDAPRAAFGVRAFAETIGVREVVFADAPFDPFLNVNTPEDLEVARRIAEGEDGVLF
ncbi:NTP transferase domain-containing protein [Gluconacetobacter takamatsuzukensis]|uniref:Molybdenum cofactor guanylyltransferase n=1 Tax=Gluconacetobacter takamatsuzukensis TaxID=1286190 RepID=A0A7W4PPL8_9PROT|nr:NTP transferase domain-containing protein [Gluconacetobacter takamatsuzukensis]MBB2205570.1 NTP transferase domain-containing protein [Gluconacetobacter takamatsuzukensis]